jgi:hypothetical protein
MFTVRTLVRSANSECIVPLTRLRLMNWKVCNFESPAISDGKVPLIVTSALKFKIIMLVSFPKYSGRVPVTEFVS